jgi:hypothetical protein
MVQKFKSEIKKPSTVQVNAQDRFSHTPLWDSIARMDRKAAEMVQNAGGKLLEDGMLAQHLCEHAKNNNVAIFELLHFLKMDVYLRVCSCTAACHTGHN